MKAKSLKEYIAGFKIEGKMSFAERIAVFLKGAADIAPKQLIAKQYIAKAIFGLTKTPLKKSDKVDIVAGAMGRARAICQERYGRSIYVAQGLGARLTTDDDDAVATTVAKTASRLVSAHTALAAEARLVDEKKLTDGEPKRWFKTNVKPTVMMLEAGERIAKLLPPKREPA